MQVCLIGKILATIDPLGTKAYLFDRVKGEWIEPYDVFRNRHGVIVQFHFELSTTLGNLKLTRRPMTKDLIVLCYSDYIQKTPRALGYEFAHNVKFDPVQLVNFSKKKTRLRYWGKQSIGVHNVRLDIKKNLHRRVTDIATATRVIRALNSEEIQMGAIAKREGVPLSLVEAISRREAYDNLAKEVTGHDFIFRSLSFGPRLRRLRDERRQREARILEDS